MAADPGGDGPGPTHVFMASEVRSGSTYIAELISYSLNESFGFDLWNLAKELLADLNDESSPDQVRKAVTSIWLSPENIRSTKIMCAQLSVLTRCARMDPQLRDIAFGSRAKWIVVRRRNRTRQAVSLAVARTTGVYHNYEQQASEERSGVSVGDIEEALRAVVLSDEYLRLFSSLPAVCTELFYEDVLKDPAGAIDRALREIGLMPDRTKFALAEAKLVPDRKSEKAELESRFAEWLLENHHPTTV